MTAPVRGRNPGQLCAVQSCGRRSRSGGYCDAHYQRSRRGLALDDPIKVMDPQRGCMQPGCERNYFSLGYCKLHYDRSKSGLDMDMSVQPRGIAKPEGTTYTQHGYVYEKRNGGWHQQHRLVMGDHLARALLRDEVVHHRNGQRDDNRLENLELWSRSHPAGQRVDEKVAWAKAFLAIYEPASLASP